jgi:DNA-binding GntR family transcriptional regulator
MDDTLIQVQATAIHTICGRLTEGQLTGLHRSVEQASRIPRHLGWDRKATAHAEIFGLLADAADQPQLARMLSLGAGFAHHLMVAAGPAADVMTASSRRRLLGRLAVGDAAGAAHEMERHLRVLRFMGRLAAGSSRTSTG